MTGFARPSLCFWGTPPQWALVCNSLSLFLLEGQWMLWHVLIRDSVSYSWTYLRLKTPKELLKAYHVHHWQIKRNTFNGEFLASGNSLSSSLIQRCRNCWTIGFSLLTIWNPVMLAPPCITLSRTMSVKPWEDTHGKRESLSSKATFLWLSFTCYKCSTKDTA